MKSTTKVIGGVILGALLGATAGILLAPEKGKDTRKKVASSVKDWKKKAEKAVKRKAEQADAVKTKVKQALNNTKETVS